MAHCALCGKTTGFGNTVTEVRTGYFKRSHRKIKPNLQKHTFIIDGQKRKLNACTRCIRTANRIRQ